MFIVHGHFTKTATDGQPAPPRPGLLPGLRLALLVALAIGLTGCTSIYHRTQSRLPTEPAAELALRLDEARTSARLVEQAAVKLHDSLRRGRPGVTIEAGFDRLEAAGYELERRALAVSDTAERLGQSADASVEIAQLTGQAQTWLDFVKSSREAEAVDQLGKLESLLDVVRGKR